MRTAVASPLTYHYGTEVLGEGKTGRVYRAIAADSYNHSRRAVALKVLRDPLGLPALQREYELLSRLNSPFFAKALAWENLAEGPAISFELIEGLSLRELADVTSEISDWADEIFAQLLDALHVLGNHREYHGDLNPDNILIDRSGHLRLIDFATPAPKMLEEQMVIHGSPAYMAPQIWAGEAASLSTDLCSAQLIHFDLGQGCFPRLTDPVAARERVLRILGEAHSRMGSPVSLDSGEWDFQRPADLQRRSDIQASMAHAVRKRLDEKTRGLTSTVAVVIKSPPVLRNTHRTNSWKPSPFRMCAIALLLIVTIPVRAQAPLFNAGPTPEGQIFIHTTKWMEVWVNGRTAGYAPTLIRNLTPGRHHITWKSAKGSGEIYLELHPGELLKLSEPRLLSESVR